MSTQTPDTHSADEDFLDIDSFDSQLEAILSQIIAMYRADDIPWVVGYSGGKDSTSVLQLVWLALTRLDASDRHKHIYVITTDTLVENPIVASWVERSLQRLERRASEEDLPLTAHRLTPKVEETYWVNLLGRGYPAPRPKFRWCTMRMKIKPSNEFINSVVRSHGEAIVVLGTRKSESSARAAVMNRLEQKSVRDNLRPHTMMPNSYVYSPIQEWTDADVWTFLSLVENPWGTNNDDLRDMYRGANPDRECPVVVEEGTPSCGDSRFGCWVCTLVEKDKSMSAMIQNDAEKSWMQPLLTLRDELIPRDEDGAPDDQHLRDFRRMHGGVELKNDQTQPIPGPYTQNTREHFLRRVLEAQVYVQRHAPEHMKDLSLITLDELREIRRIWVNEKHELEDSLPQIYENVLGTPFPDNKFTEDLPIGGDEISLLRDICGNDRLQFELTRELLSVERQHRHLARRHGLFTALERSVRKHFYDDATDATKRAQDHQSRLTEERRRLDALDGEETWDQQPSLPLDSKDQEKDHHL